jgi:hypothetical protein
MKNAGDNPDRLQPLSEGEGFHGFLATEHTENREK